MTNATSSGTTIVHLSTGCRTRDLPRRMWRTMERIGFRVRMCAQILRGNRARLGRSGACTTLSMMVSGALAIVPPEAVGSLYLNDTGEYLCTATVVDGSELDFEQPLVVLTAAHCIERFLHHDFGSGRLSSRQGYRIEFADGERFEVVPVRVGFAAAGFDLAVLRFRTEVPDLTPLRMGSWEQIDVGTIVQIYANSLGWGIQYSRGPVSLLGIAPFSDDGGSRLTDNAVASLQVGPGSSGGLILMGSREYVGVLSGVIRARTGSTFTVFVPQWKFAQFLTRDEAGRNVRCPECPLGWESEYDLALVGRFTR